jgi:peroxiredoxin Q/BCP
MNAAMRPSLRVALAAGALAAGCFRAVHTDEPLLPVGAAAPEVVGVDAKGTTFKLSAQTGRYAIVYFYPKDDTPGCTKEACAFRDAFEQFVAAGVTIFGVSRDDDASHRAFLSKYTLPFPLVADPSGEVQKAYRVPPTAWGGAKRVTFLVGPDAKIARVFPDVDPGTHAKQLLDVIATLSTKGKG